MRKLLVILAVAVQLGILAVMVVGRESILFTGDRLYLRTSPVDPRDPFRGDYVQLQFPMNSLDQVKTRLTSDDQLEKGKRVYAVLEVESGDRYRVNHVTDEKPSDGLFIRGKVNSGGWRPDNSTARYGVEQYFVEQGTGYDLERKRGAWGELQTPMEMEIAVSGSGTAVITGHRWSRLGIHIELLHMALPVANENPQSADQAGSASSTPSETAVESSGNSESTSSDSQPSLRLTIQNTSEDSVLVNDPSHPCSWDLRERNVSNPAFRRSMATCNEPQAPAEIRLAPGDKRSLEVDLADPHWFVESIEDTEVGANDIRRFTMTRLYRFVFHSTPAGKISDEHWVGELPSQAFSGQGRID